MTMTRRILFLAFFLIAGIALTGSQASFAVRTGTHPSPADAGGIDALAISRRAPSINDRLESSLGKAANPLWLTLHVSTEGVPLNDGSQMFGKVNAPAGSATLNSRLTVNGGRIVTILAQTPHDTTPPVITIAEPTEGLITNTSPVTVSGTVTDASPVTITVNNQPATLSGTQFEASIILTEGLNIIIISATDAFGNVATVSRNIRFDSTPPIITVESPIDRDAFVFPQDILVSGKVTDSTPTQFFINDLAVDVLNGSFEKMLPLQEGRNIITLKAIDAGMNTTIVNQLVIGDNKYPIVTLGPLPVNLMTTDEEITLTGSIVDDSSVIVSINSSIVEVTNNQFSVTLPLDKGENSFKVDVTDQVGYFWEQDIRIQRIIPFTLTIEHPIEGKVYGTNLVNVTGLVDGSNVEILLNGEPLNIAGNEFRGYLKNLTEGQHTIEVVGTDLPGEVKRIHRAFKIDLTPPVITELEPRNHTMTTSDFINVQGKVLEANRFTVKVNGLDAQVQGDTFLLPHLPLKDGYNNINIEVTDEALHSILETITIQKRPSGSRFDSLASSSQSINEN